MVGVGAPESNPQKYPRISYHTVVTLSKCMVPSSSSGRDGGPLNTHLFSNCLLLVLAQALCPALAATLSFGTPEELTPPWSPAGPSVMRLGPQQVSWAMRRRARLSSVCSPRPAWLWLSELLVAHSLGAQSEACGAAR